MKTWAAISRICIFALIWVFLSCVLSFGEETKRPPMAWEFDFPKRLGKQVLLMWVPVRGAQAYNIYRSDTPNEEGILLGTSPANNYMDAAPDLNKDNYYHIKYVIDGLEPLIEQLTGKIDKIVVPDVPVWRGCCADYVKNQNKLFLYGDGKYYYEIFKSTTANGKFELIGATEAGLVEFVDSNFRETAYYKAVKVWASGHSAGVKSPESEILSVEYLRPRTRPVHHSLPDIDKQ